MSHGGATCAKRDSPALCVHFGRSKRKGKPEKLTDRLPGDEPAQEQVAPPPGDVKVEDTGSTETNAGDD